jgi:uncharacterized protein (TIGR03083 family)
MDAADELQGYVDTWAETVEHAVALLRSLDEDDWSRPTDLPGWDVRAVAAHLAHLESELAGSPQDQVEVPGLPHVASVMSAYTEIGPIARRDWPTERIVDELESASRKRLGELRADPPTDLAAPAARTPGGIGWSWRTLLSNRPLDVWMHEQDIRRAVGRPGGMDSAGAAHTLGGLLAGAGYVVGKRVRPPAGGTVVLDVRGPTAVHVAAGVGEDGRGRLLDDDPPEPSVTLRMGTETYVVLAGGRRRPSELDVEVVGDQELGRRVLDAMAVTP